MFPEQFQSNTQCTYCIRLAHTGIELDMKIVQTSNTILRVISPFDRKV
jgi:hypothetical protein